MQDSQETRFNKIKNKMQGKKEKEKKETRCTTREINKEEAILHEANGLWEVRIFFSGICLCFLIKS